jgi:macrodomain Ter protein organizer (MatP/YcbG family)
MNPIFKERQDRILRLQDRLRAGANRLLQANAQKITGHSTKLTHAIWQRSWRQAGLLCSTLGRLIQIQTEAEGILKRSNGGPHGRRD